MKNFKQEIKALIKERKAKYRKQDNSIDIDEIKATSNREKETTGDYNGRQLLELIQNADDAKSNEILFNLNTQTHTLIIANRGEPFTCEGIKSLLMANLSSKKSSDNIGNKGLGFRSIINWSDKITINSNDLDISFSQDIAVNAFKDSGLKKTELPILAIPKVTKNPQNKWTTSITIKYKDNFLDDIKSQIKHLKSEILLFLNHLTSIKIDIDGDKQDINKHDIWTIKLKEGEFPDEYLTEGDTDIKYELKIAYNKKLTNNNNKYLFSYFPTKIDIDFPFIIHGTFELDSSRNQLTDNAKNKFIIGELVDFIIKTALSFTKKEVNYQALEFLQYKHENPVLLGLGFYEKIKQAIEVQDIYPCIDNTYRKKEGIVYSNDLSQFVKKVNFCDLLSYLLIPIDNDNIIEILDGHNLDNFSYFDEQTKGIELLNEKINNTNDRVNFIDLLIKNDFKKELPLLTDENDNLINSDDDIYTPAESDFSLPNYVHIKVINKDLYRELEEIIEDDLVGKLKCIVPNFKQSNTVEILRKVITSTNRELELENAKTVDLIKSMLKCLYKNYSNSITISDQTIQLLNKGQQLQKAKNLYLSKTYPSGELTEELFGDIFTDDDFLANIDDFGLEGNKQDIEDFFLWLGVNKHTKFTKRNDERMEIYDFDKIKNTISQEKFILWAVKDKKIKDNVGKKYTVVGRRMQEVQSAILEQLISSNFFTGYLLGDNQNINKLVNNSLVNYQDELFKKYDINEYDINSLLLKIGAVKEFSKLGFQKVKNVLKTLPEKDSKGKYAQKLYIESFKFKEQYYSLDDDIKLFANKGKEKGYFNQDEIYYSGVKKLPKKYTNTKAIFDYPRRQNTKKIIDFFNIKDLSKIEISIKNKEKSNINQEFLQYFQKIKPYILAYRVENIENQLDKKDEAKKTQQIQIDLYNNISCEIEGEQYQLSDYDYLIENEDNMKNYLIKIPDKNLNHIIKTYDFYTTFGNILGLVFDVVGVEKFQNCIKDSEENLKQAINDHISSNAINDAKGLLGINTDFYNFWSVIYQLLNKEYTDNHNDNIKLINKELDINITDKTVNYEDLSKNSDKLIDLFQSLEISVDDFNNDYIDSIDFSKYHQNKLENCFNDNKNKFKQCLHQYCQKNNEQSHYLDKLAKYKEPQDNNYQTTLLVDYQQICDKFIKNNFLFTFKDNNATDIEGIFTSNEQIILTDERLPNNVKSWLYFKDGYLEVEKWLTQQLEKIPQSRATEEKPIKQIEEEEYLQQGNPAEGNVNNHHGRYDPNRERQNKKAGDAAEQEVYDALVEEYGDENVNWESKTNDSAGYDIYYKDKDKGESWYVEVKTKSNGKFYISENEKEFAKKNQKNYKIFLVGDKIESFLVDFENNNPKLIPYKYLVHYENQ